MAKTIFSLQLVEHRWLATCELCAWERHCTDTRRASDLMLWDIDLREHTAHHYSETDVPIARPRWRHASENFLGNAHDAVQEFNRRFPNGDAEIVSIPANGQNGVPGSVSIVVYRYLTFDTTFETPTTGTDNEGQKDQEP